MFLNDSKISLNFANFFNQIERICEFSMISGILQIKEICWRFNEGWSASHLISSSEPAHFLVLATICTLSRPSHIKMLVFRLLFLWFGRGNEVARNPSICLTYSGHLNFPGRLNKINMFCSIPYWLVNNINCPSQHKLS